MNKNANKDYSYLDYCVFTPLRPWVLANEPVVLFSHALDAVLWSNAAGAAFFGCESIGEMLQSKPSPSQPFIKQLKDAVPQIEGQEPLRRGFRIIRGMRSELIDCELRQITLPNGETTYLLVAYHESRMAKPSEYDTAQTVANSLLGFASAAAVADDAGLTLAATDTFSRLDMDPDLLTDMVKKVLLEEDRLVKAPIDTHEGTIYALGIARVSDRPGRNLIVLAGPVGPDASELSPHTEAPSHAPTVRPTPIRLDPAPQPQPALAEPAESTSPASADQAKAEPGDFEMKELNQPLSRAGLLQSRWRATAYASPYAIQTSPPSPDPVETPSPQVANDEPAAQQAPDKAAAPSPSPSETQDRPATDDQAPGEQAGSDANRSTLEREDSQEPPVATPDGTAQRSPEDDEADQPQTQPTLAEAESTEPADLETIEIQEAPSETGAKPDHRQAASTDSSDAEFAFEEKDEAVRFAWTINADQIFVSVSPEFAETVGPRAADVVDRKWSDVAAVFGFDETGAISELLSRKDTWSGKSVLWPVQGTDILVPIDLAALPAFSGEREFEGFKGFGIIRTADAVLDPNSVGLALSESKNLQELASPHTENRDEASQDDEDAPIRQTLPPDDDDAMFIGNVVDLVSRLPTSEEDGGPAAPREDLTSEENEYFAEIGERLRETADSEWELGKRDTTDDDPAQAEEVIAPSGVVAKPVPLDILSDDDDDPRSEHVERHREAAAQTGPVDHSILDELPVPVLIYKNGDTLFANPQLLELTQYESVEEIDQLGGMDGLLEDPQTAGESGQHRLKRRDGSSRAVNLILRSVPWDQGRAIMATFQPKPARDTDEQKGLMDVARISEMQDILDTATDGIIVLNRDGMVESFNGSAEALFGHSSAKIVGSNIETLFALESRNALLNYIKTINERDLKSIINDGCELIGKEANGGLIPLFVTLGKMGDSSKLCMVIRDMTSWKKSEEDLVNARRQAEKASDQKSDFLARVSHEIRTPLNAIIGFSDVMIEERFGPIANDRYREYLLDINRSGIHVLDLVNDLLDLSKIESGKIDLSFEAVDLNQIVAETVALMQPQANSNRIIIRTSLSRVVPKVVADARSMRQIIMNLVSNAIKFSQANGQVIVSTVYEGNGEVALRIRDTGVGMTDDELKDAMKPFYQIPGVSEKSSKGTGLGLPLTKALVEANRAHFDLESRLNEGTIAHVQFPTQRVLAD